MNYDHSKLPKRPCSFPIDYNDLIYIGHGTSPISIAEKYNNGECFLSYFCQSYRPDKWSDFKLETNSGFNATGHYFVPKDSTLLPKMFPLENFKSQIAQIRVDVACIIANALEDLHDKRKLTSILKAIHEKVISVAKENEIDINEIISIQKAISELNEDIVI